MTDEKKKKEHSMKKAAIEGAAAEVVQRYGSANKEYLVAYSGIDNETGETLKKSLKSITEEKINPDYKYQNTKQQAGFSAEVLDTADSNAENIINKNPNRKNRTDDIKPTTEPNSGKVVGGTNDQLFDQVERDAKGNIIPGSAAQMKFVGKNPKECLNTLMSKKCQKYLDADAKIVVPADFYDGVIAEANDRIEQLKKQLESNKIQDEKTIKAIQEKIKKLEKLKRNLRKSTVSNKGPSSQENTRNLPQQGES